MFVYSLGETVSWFCCIGRAVVYIYYNFLVVLSMLSKPSLQFQQGLLLTDHCVSDSYSAFSVACIFM